MLGEHPLPLNYDAFDLEYVGVKASQFSFSRLNQADPVPGVDMASTGEVGCLGDTFDEALLKAMISVGYTIPAKGSAILVSSGNAHQKASLLEPCRLLAAAGYRQYATAGTCKYLQDNGVPASRVLWPSDTADGDNAPRALDMIRSHEVALVVNIPKNFTQGELTNGYKLRRAAIDMNVPLITNSRLATAFIKAFTSSPELKIKSWDEYVSL